MSNNHGISESFVTALSIRTKNNSQTEFLRNAFINCFEYVFNDFANNKQIIERIKDGNVS